MHLLCYTIGDTTLLGRALRDVVVAELAERGALHVARASHAASQHTALGVRPAKCKELTVALWECRLVAMSLMSHASMLGAPHHLRASRRDVGELLFG